MPDYQNGKIYVLRLVSNDKIFYVGSTVNPLYKRANVHRFCLKSEKRTFPVYKYINKKGGSNAFYIQLYKSFPCNNREELNRKEGQCMLKLKKKGYQLKNCKIAGRTHAEYTKSEEGKEVKTKYRTSKKGKEVMKKAFAKYYATSEAKEKIATYNASAKGKAVRKLAGAKSYVKAMATEVTCKCGLTTSAKNYLRHLKTKKHEIALAQIKN